VEEERIVKCENIGQPQQQERSKKKRPAHFSSATHNTLHL
jgi:hypothetical protein